MLGHGPTNSGNLRNFHIPQDLLSSDDNGNWQLHNNTQGKATTGHAAASRLKLSQGRAAKANWWIQLPFTTEQEPSQVQGHTPNHALGQVQGQGNTTQNPSPPRPIISCKRCLSGNGLHSAKNCPSITYCHFCNNWSHNSNNCRKAPPNRR